MNLIVWQRALDLFQLTWKIAFEESKIDFKLRSQFADAAQSVSANISEGYGRRSVNEYIQYLYIALGSMAETMTRAIGLNLVKQITYRMRMFERDTPPQEMRIGATLNLRERIGRLLTRMQRHSRSTKT